MAARPRIALTLARPTQRNEGSRQRYIDALERAGAEVVALFPGDEMPDDADGLLLSGGGDIASARYDEPDQACAEVDPARDEMELAAVRRAIELDLPVLGICRGFQLLNVALGGRLLQDVDGHRPAEREGVLLHEDVRPSPGSRLAAAVGEGPLAVNSRHHQAVSETVLAADLVPTALVGELVEAFESRSQRWLVGMQWHPERTAEVSPAALCIFDALVAEASRTAAHAE